MSNKENKSIWFLIQDNMKEIEKLLGQRLYNLSMIKSRQTLEQMVKYLYKNISEETNIDLIDMIDELYLNNLIPKSTCENYHKIRMIGNKAIHNDDNNSYSANNAFSLLSQEVTIFSNDQYLKQRKFIKKKPKLEKPKHKISTKKQKVKTSYNFFILLILFVLISLSMFLLKTCKNKTKEETLAKSVESQEIEITKESEVEIEETIEETKQIYLTTHNLNIRSAPSVEGNKIDTVPPNTELFFVKDYDADWAVIEYNNAQAYVSRKYIKIKE